MQVVTCQVGGTLRLGKNTRIVIHRRDGELVVLGATAPAGTPLIFGGESLRPMSGRADTWSFLFSSRAIRCFTLGAHDLRLWLPGELVPLAADCDDWLHIGVTPPPMRSRSRSTRACSPAPPPAPVPPVRPLRQASDGGRLFFVWGL